MNGPARCCIVAIAAAGLAAPCAGEGLEAVGNTDGVLTWRLADLARGASAREVVLLAYGDSLAKLTERLGAARRHFAKLPAPPAAAAAKAGAGCVWIANDATDFALEPAGFFRWRSKRQALRCRHGGQLSQFTWYVHYRDAAGEHRAGTPHVDPSRPERLRIVEPVRRRGKEQALGVLATTDGRLGIRIRAAMGPGSAVGVEFVLTNTGDAPLTDVRLTAYANLEAAHTHEGDYTCLDSATGGLLVIDPATRMHLALAGLRRPAGGHAGTWCSLGKLQAADGVPLAKWKPLDPKAMAKRLAQAPARPRPRRAYGQMIIPPVLGAPRTPPTRTLTAAEADKTLRRDWLFQAMGEPLASRTAKEIAWARQLAERLAGRRKAGALAAELAELDALEKRLASLTGRPLTGQLAKGDDTPSWIWYPEGAPAAGAPVAARFFRLRFDLPAAVKSASLHVAADDHCEVYLNAARVGTNDTWRVAAAFPVARLLKPGRNVLAVRAENKAANVAQNPAGLICRLAVTLADGTPRTLVSDASWRVSLTGPARWVEAGFDDSAWKPARLAAPFGGGPWARIEGLMGPNAAVLAYAHEPPAARELYFAVRRVKRRIAMKNPVLNFTGLLVVDQPMPRGPVNPEHEAIHRMGISAVPGGRLLVLDGLHPGGAVRKLAPEKPGSFWRPDLSFDARRVLFCFKPHDEKSFHLYEIHLDGTGLRKLTDSEYDDVDPIYLPDGHILFTTTRANSYVRCGPFIYSYTLARCNADGSDVYLISCNGEPDFVPSLLADGRVIYSRWEYTDKPLWRMQSLWTANPDGTGVAVFWGNQSIWPDHQSQPMQIPGSGRVMFCGVGHHDWWSGSVGIIDPARGFNFPNGLTKVTRDLPWPESGNGPVDPPESPRYHASGRFTGYTAAVPLSEADFLVCARGAGRRFRLYLMDVDGNRELIYEGAHNVLQAVPVRRRRKPPALADRVAWPGTGKDRKPLEPATFYSADVCQGVGDLPRRAVKYLRVLQQDHKTYSTWEKTYRNSGPAVSIVQEEAVKRILGVVPVHEDGSVYFRVPPGRSLYFQLLDKDYRCLQTMRSFAGLMPGERRGCLGCHEMHSTTPVQSRGLAFRHGPRDLTPPPWGTETIGYERFVQPVLDKHCGRCHQGKGKGRKKLDLTLRPGHGPFKEPYLTLVGAAGWGGPARNGPGCGIAAAIPVESRGTYKTIRPMSYLSFKSKLIARAMSGRHHRVKVDPVGLRRLIAWVDACCPFRGEPEIRALDDPDFPGIERLPIRPRVKTAPIIERP